MKQPIKHVPRPINLLSFTIFRKTPMVSCSLLTSLPFFATSNPNLPFESVKNMSRHIFGVFVPFLSVVFTHFITTLRCLLLFTGVVNLDAVGDGVQAPDVVEGVTLGAATIEEVFKLEAVTLEVGHGLIGGVFVMGF